MKTFLRKTWLIALMLVLGASTAWADEVKWVAANASYENQAEVTDVTVNPYISLSFAKGSSSNTPKYFTSGTAVRAYRGNTIAVNATNATITGIEFSFGSSDGSNAITAKPGSFTSPKWSGSANAITFTIGGTTGNRRISAIKVTYTTSGGSVTPPVTTEYAISYDQSLTNGYVTGPAKGKENDVISLTAVPYDGFELSAWNVKNASTNEAINVNNNKFTMPAANVNVSAIFGAITDDAIVSTITLGNDFWGTEYTGTISSVKGNSFTLTGSQDGITVTLFNGTSTSAYITNEQTRCYKNYTLKFEVPEGYVFKDIIFSADGTNWTTPEPNVGVIDNKEWTSNSNRTVTFTFTDTSRITNVQVSYILGDDNGDGGGGVIGGEVSPIPNFIQTPSVEIALNGESYDVRTNLNIPKDYNTETYAITTTINGVTEKDGEYTCIYPYLAFQKVGTYPVHVVAAATDKYAETTGDFTLVVYDPNEPTVDPDEPSSNVYASLAELVAAGKPSTTARKITVTLTKEEITRIFVTSQGYRNGIFLKVGEKEIEIYSQNVPEAWVAGGTVSGTLTDCDWKLYNSTWELCPADWNELEYKAPVVTPVEPTVYASLTELVAAGTPTTEGSKVTVTLTNEEIKDIYVTGANNYRNGIFLEVGEQQIEIYCKNVPEAWVVGGTVSGQLVNCDWKRYNDTWELCPADWTELTYTAPAVKVLSAVIIASQPTKTEYLTAESFDVTGLTVSAVYDNETSTDITNAVEWTITPATFTAEGTTTVKVIATYNEMVSTEMTYTVTVTKNPYVTAGDFTDIKGNIDENISYKAFQGTAGTAPAINSGCIRLYQNGGYITISGAKGVKISEVILTTGSTYATTTIGTAIDGADAPTEGTAVEKNTDFTVSGLSCNSISFYCLGTDKYTRLDVASIKVKYEREDIELVSIGISGEGLKNPDNRFIRYSEFNHDKIVITARYSDGTTAEVTEKAEFSAPDMTVTGQQTIHVNYTEGGKTVHNAYLIYVDNDYAVSMYADLTRTKTLYRIGETINEADAVFKGDYKSGRKDVDIETTGHYEWTKPDMTTLGKKQVRVRLIESGDNPTAEYTIYVVPANTIFFESFDKTEGKGGNDDSWSGQIASSSIKYDNEGWVSTPAGGASQCLRCGNGNTAGSATTPALGHAGSVTVSFKAAAWDGANEKTTITVSIIDGDETSAQTIELVKGEWSDYSVTLDGLTAESKVKFSAVQASNNRFFLDEVLITVSTSATVGTLVKYIKGLNEGEGSLEGLQKIVDDILGN